MATCAGMVGGKVMVDVSLCVGRVNFMACEILGSVVVGFSSSNNSSSSSTVTGLRILIEVFCVVFGSKTTFRSLRGYSSKGAAQRAALDSHV